MIDFSGNVKLPDSEVSNLRHFCKTHITRGLKVGDTSAKEKREKIKKHRIAAKR